MANSNPNSNSPSPRTPRSGWFSLRQPIPTWQSALLGLIFMAMVGGLWWFVTRQEVKEERLVDYLTLPSPAETVSEFPSLWFDRAFTRNALTTLRRVIFGFGLACVVGVPVGVLAGCFSRVGAMLSPLIVFGRNIPIAALIPLTFAFFGIEESQKVAFIFFASAAFIVADAAQAIRDVDQRYVDTAKTLGAGTWQTIIKVLFPLAMPSIFNSLRILFGLAFGYIMLAESISNAGAPGGLGFLINQSQGRSSNKEHVYLIVLIIPVLALAIDRLLFWVQRELFPHRYGGYGFLNRALGAATGVWDNIKCAVINPEDPGPPKPTEWQP